MTRPPAPPRIEVTRLALDAQGYDGIGGYWGQGQPVYLVSRAGDEATLRAANAREARAQAEAVLDEAAAKRSAEGRTRLHLEWPHPLTGEPLLIRIEHRPDHFIKGVDHLEITAIRPRRAPLPITETGYLSHFINADHLAEAGGPERFILEWLRRAAANPKWRSRESLRRQGDLFDHADRGKPASPPRQPRRRFKPGKPQP